MTRITGGRQISWSSNPGDYRAKALARARATLHEKHPKLTALEQAYREAILKGRLTDAG